MARFSGARGSRRRVAGQPVSPVTPPFKRRSDSGVLSASGIAARVAARRQAALQLNHSGADARQPIVLSNDGTDVDDEAPTPLVTPRSWMIRSRCMISCPRSPRLRRGGGRVSLYGCSPDYRQSRGRMLFLLAWGVAGPPG